MQFKEWYYLQEKIDANTKANLTIQINNRFKDDEEKRDVALDLLQAIDKEEEDYKSNIGVISKKIFADPRLKKEKSVDGLLSKVDRFNTIEFDGTPEDKENIKQTLKYFFNQGILNDQLEEMMNLLKRFIPEKKVKLEFDVKPILFVRNADRGWQQVNETGFTQFSAHLHAIDSMLQKQKSASHYFNPSTEFDQDEHLVAKGDNIWVFKGGRPDICRRLGKGQKWCISSTSSASHWFDYRMDHGQTQYFIFDFNYPEDHPARYVNPGVAPEGKYSEWVDFRNYPNRIAGFSSIQKYKKYLSDKGVKLSVFKADPIQDWETRLQEYVDEKDVDGARKNKEIFDLFLKIVNTLGNPDFNSLNDEEKKTYLLGRIRITENQSKFAFERFRKDYLDSLNFNDDDITELLKIAPSEYKQEIAKLIIQKKTELTGSYVYELLYHATDKQEIAKLLGSENINKLNDDDVYRLLYDATDPQEMANILGSENINKLNDWDVHELLRNARNKQEMAKSISQYKTELTGDNVYFLLFYATNKREMAKIIGLENINKLSEENVYNLLLDVKNKREMADSLGSENINKLSHQRYVYDLLLYATGKREMANILGSEKINKLSDDYVYKLLFYATDKQEIANILGSENINKLSDHYVYKLLLYATDKREMADILGSENINKLIDDYVYMLLSSATDKREMADIVGSENINKLSDDNVVHLLREATDKQEIAKIVGSENLNKLSDYKVYELLRYATYKQEIAEAILKNLTSASQLSSETIEELEKIAKGEF